jgi:rhodanese-related sulfurtransferase
MISWLSRLLRRGVVEGLTPEQAQAKAKAGALILDVRTPLERQETKIPSAQALPLDRLAAEWEKLPKHREIICHCRSGSRSATAARFLAAKGFKVYNLKGGIVAWQAAKLPLK